MIGPNMNRHLGGEHLSTSADKSIPVRPPYDPELEVGLAGLPADIFGTEDGPSSIEETRALMASWRPSIESLTLGGAVDIDEHTIPGPQGSPDIKVLIMSPSQGDGPWPVIYHIHGGAMVAGDRYTGAQSFADLVVELKVVVVSVEYRLAPENPHPAPVEDCYAGLVWVADNTDALKIDPRRIVILGGSAGSGLAASTALLARDRKGPVLSHQILGCPMLDHRLTGPSTYAADLHSRNMRKTLQEGWGILLSEAVEYATRLSYAGVQVELHVWPGAFHGFNSLVPHAAVSRTANETRLAYLRRVLH